MIAQTCSLSISCCVEVRIDSDCFAHPLSQPLYRKSQPSVSSHWANAVNLSVQIWSWESSTPFSLFWVMFLKLDWLSSHSSYRVEVHDVFVYSLCVHEPRAGSLHRTAEPRHIMYSLCTHKPTICWVWFQSLMTWQRTRKSPCLKFCSSDLISLTACLRDNLRFQLFLCGEIFI